MALTNVTLFNSSKYSNYTHFSMNKDLALSMEVINSIYTVWITLVNMAVIVTILSAKVLRRRLRNQLIVSIAFVDLLTGVVYCPLAADYGRRTDWNHACLFRVIFQVFYWYVDVFVVFWTLVVMDIDYLLRLLRVSILQLSPRWSSLLNVIPAVVPWIALCVVLLPLIFTDLNNYDTILVNCYLHIRKEREIILRFLCVFVPAIIAFVVIILVFLSQRLCPKEGQDVQRLEQWETTESPVCVLVPFLISVGMGIPESFAFILEFVGIIATLDNDTFMKLFISIGYVDTARSGVLPLAWLLIPDIRSVVKERLNWLLQRKPNILSSSILTFSYRKFHDSQ